jgi:hypothetical protein
VSAARCKAGRGRALAALSLALACGSGLAAPQQPLRFEQVFRGDAKASLHYRAEFGAPGAQHELEAWVLQDRRLKRVTDGAVETHAERAPGEAEYDLTVLDLKRRISTRIRRTNLLRIGSFTDWFDLAHGLRHPRGDYRLVHASAPAAAPQPLRSCQWYALAEGGRTTHVCWSAADAVPVLLLSADGAVLWRLTAVDHAAVPERSVAIHDTGFVRNDANRDIEAD